MNLFSFIRSYCNVSFLSLARLFSVCGSAVLFFFILLSLSACAFNPFLSPQDNAATWVAGTQQALGNQPATSTPIPAKPARLLPHSVFLISAADGQLWRIAPDAKTTSQLTNGSAISAFDVSPLDTSLVYVRDNQLWRSYPNQQLPDGVVATAQTDGPEERFAGVLPVNQIYMPHWSPDGQFIAFGYNGIELVNAVSGQLRSIRSNDTDFAYAPLSFSPDGKFLLVHAYSIAQTAMPPNLLVLNVADGTTIASLPPDSAYVSWTQVGNNLYGLKRSSDGVWRELWLAMVGNNFTLTLIPASANLSFFAPQEIPDARLAYFMALPESPAQFQMMAADLDATSNTTALRNDSFALQEVLWDTQGMGALVSLSPAVVGGNPSGLLWLSIDNAPALSLPLVGSQLHWGDTP